MVKVNKVIDTMKESPLWETLSREEQTEAINYAFEMAGLKTDVYRCCRYPERSITE